MGMLCDIKGEQSSPAAAWSAGMRQDELTGLTELHMQLQQKGKSKEKQLLSSCTLCGNSLKASTPSNGIVQHSIPILMGFFSRFLPQSKQRKKIWLNVFWSGKVSQ